MAALHDLVDMLAQDLAGIHDCDHRHRMFLKHVQRFGVTRFAYLNTSHPRDPMHVETNYPTDWVRHYLTRDYLRVDAVVLEAGRTPLPFRWRAALELPHYGATARQVFHEAAAFGITDGYSVPVHASAGMSVVSLVVEDAGLFRPSAARNRQVLHLLALHFHLACDRALAEAPIPAPRLTPREREILLWAAKGKTGGEIARILNLTERTVAYHLGNARTKLGAASPAQAVVAALSLGLIRP